MSFRKLEKKLREKYLKTQKSKKNSKLKGNQGLGGTRHSVPKWC